VCCFVVWSSPPQDGKPTIGLIKAKQPKMDEEHDEHNLFMDLWGASSFIFGKGDDSADKSERRLRRRKSEEDQEEDQDKVAGDTPIKGGKKRQREGGDSSGGGSTGSVPKVRLGNYGSGTITL